MAKDGKIFSERKYLESVTEIIDDNTYAGYVSETSFCRHLTEKSKKLVGTSPNL